MLINQAVSHFSGLDVRIVSLLLSVAGGQALNFAGFLCRLPFHFGITPVFLRGIELPLAVKA